MSPLNHKSLAECKTKVLYHVWKGQLFIQDQRVCDIVLQSPFSISIPAQLPAKLEIKHAMSISELKKKLPEAAFRRKNYSDHEVKYQDTSFCLYEVELLNQNEPKVEQLLENLKEKNLALVKYLNDQAALILLASSAFVKEKDADSDEPSCLQALFRFSSPGTNYSTVAKDWKWEHRSNEKYLQVTSVVPGLYQALLEATKQPLREELPLSALVKRHIQEFTKQRKDSPSGSDSLDNLPAISFDMFLKRSDLDTLSEKCCQNSFSHLQFYLLHLENYTLKMSEAVACLDASSEDPDGSHAPGLDSSSCSNMELSPPAASETSTRPRRAVQLNLQTNDAAAKTNQSSDRPFHWGKRKSSRLLGATARKQWSPMALCIIENKKRQKAKKKKKKKSPPLPLSKTPERPTDTKELTLQLKNFKYPPKRKRGAEVLFAEFVHGTRCEPTIKATSSSESLAGREKRPRLLKSKKDEEKAKVEERVEIRRPVTRRSARLSMNEALLEVQKEVDYKNDSEGEKASGPDDDSSENKEECDSHALNMLADLALSSCNTPESNKGSQCSLATSPLRQCCHLQRGEVLHNSSDHEYHRAMKKQKDASLSGKACQHSLSSPGEGSLRPELPSNSQERSSMSSKKNESKRPGLSKSHTMLSREDGDILDSNIPSQISVEHSYASPALEPYTKEAPGSSGSKNGVKNMKSGPLVLPGKVLPFRHQQNICHSPKQLKNSVQFIRSAIMAARLKEDFSKSHKVTFRDKNVRVTFQWEAEYVFSLDSKYTNNTLEKTVVRAVHGPWDVSQSDCFEEMKLILHMWVALFYSKPLKSTTVRKVVEHSNPAKYISLNSVADPLELIDDSEGAYSLEKCPADSLSEANLTPSEVKEKATSSSDKPLSCNELSSTNRVEDDLPLDNSKEPHDSPLMGEEIQTPARSSEDTVSPLDEVPRGKEPEKEFVLVPVLPVEIPPGNTLGKPSDGSARPQDLIVDAKAETSEPVNVGEVSKRDAAPTNAELPQNLGSKQREGNTEAATSAERWEIRSFFPPAEEKKSHQAAGVELLHTSEAVCLEPTAPEDNVSPCGEAIESQDLPRDEEDGVEESMEWESIDLALSESNDTDEESRDVDLEQEGEASPEETGMAEERETGSVCGTASPVEGQLTSVTSPATVSEHQRELPRTEEDPVVLPASSASLNQKDLIEGHCPLQENTVDSRADSLPPQASSVRNEGVELLSIVSTKHPNQMDVSENAIILCLNNAIFLCLNKGTKAADSVSPQDSELFQAEKDLATQGELERSQDSLVSVRNPLFPNPDDLTDISNDSMEGKDLSVANSVLPQSTPVHQTASDAVAELPGNQEASTEPTKHHIFLNRVDLIEDISQDDIHLADSAPLQTCQVQMSTQGKATGNQEDYFLSVKNLPPEKEMVLIQGSCVPQKEEGIHLLDTAQLSGSSDHQTTDEVIELTRNQVDSSISATTTSLPEPMVLSEEFCIAQEKEACHPADTSPLQTNEVVQRQQSAAILEEQKTRQTELLNDHQAEKEFQNTEADNQEFDLISEDEKCCMKDENIKALSSTQEVISGDKINQVTVTVSEDIKSVLCELIDAVSALTVESEESRPQETSSLNWINSVTLECVTPPDSDEENTSTDQLNRTDQKWMVNEDLEQHSSFAHEERATSQGQELHHSPLCEEMRSGQVDTLERMTLQENEHVFPSSSSIDQSATSTTSQLCKSPLVQMASSKEGDPTASRLCESEVGEARHKSPMSEGEDQFSEACVEIPPCLAAERQIESDSFVDGDTRGGLAESEDVQLRDARQSLEDSEDAIHEIRTKSLGSPEGTLTSEKAQLPASNSGMNKNNWEDEPFAGHRNQEHIGSSHHSSKAGGTYGPRSIDLSETVVASYISDVSPEEEIRGSGDWMCLENTERLSALEPEPVERNWPLMFKEGDSSLDTNSERSPIKDYVNFSVTKKPKEKTRTFHPSKRNEGFTGDLGLINSLNRTWGTASDPTQNTLDMECLRFHYKIKQVLRKPQLPTSTDTFAKQLSSPVAAETLLSRKAPETPPLNPPPRSRSPLLITVLNTDLRHDVSHWHPRSRHRDTIELPPPASSQEFLSKAARCKGQGPGSGAPFHLNKLTYKNKLKDSRGDISVIMDEFAEFSRVMMLDGRPATSKGWEPMTTSEDAPEKRGSSLSRRTASYEHLFDELWNTLHYRLKNVAQEACKKTFAFYLMETDDDPFFGRIKNLLKKGGHTEMEPLVFCKANHLETERLMVIIRNEDIFPHMHKIPCLLQLKHFPSVTFAGVDSPEDMLDQTYQELFHSGGFVVSDDKVLEMMTTGELKEMVKTLERLSGYGRWRWLLHYKEMKKLREDARVDSAARAKESLLKSFQGANITEALHYHQCDSKAALRSEHLNCLLNLQVQHISQRFAVFLTEKPSPSREALENKGILVLDANTFIATAEDMVAPFRSSSY